MQDAATIQPRMANIAALVPEALRALLALGKSAKPGGLPATTAFLVHLRARQINGCSFCAEMHSRELKEAGEPDERIWTIAAWREAPYFPQRRAHRAGAHRGRYQAERPRRPGTR